MSQLAQLQHNFQAYIIDQAKGADFKQRIVNDKKVGAKKRLGIYADGYRLRIIEALANAYPKLQAFLGDQLFNQTARAYIDAYPSHYRNMRWVGDEMDTHLRKTLSQHVVAAELAAFEWALGLAFDAEDAPILQLQDLADIPPEAWGELHFAFHPSLQLLDLDWNVIPIWQALDADETPPEPQQIHELCLVWRSDMNSHYRTTEALEHKAVQNVMAGATFASLCEDLFTTLGDDATLQAAQYLSTWLEAGMISKIQT
jgi:hypothetical protein